MREIRSLLRAAIGELENGNILLPDISGCDSPIEDICYAELQKVLSQEAKIFRQVSCPTGNGTFRLDFMVCSGSQRIGIECDGKQFHDAEKDSRRDRSIIEAGFVQKIFRMRGTDIFARLHDALDLIAQVEEDIFSTRGLAIIKARSMKVGTFEDVYYRLSTIFPHCKVREAVANSGAEESADDDDSESPHLASIILYWT